MATGAGSVLVGGSAWPTAPTTWPPSSSTSAPVPPSSSATRWADPIAQLLWRRHPGAGVRPGALRHLLPLRHRRARALHLQLDDGHRGRHHAGRPAAEPALRSCRCAAGARGAGRPAGQPAGLGGGRDASPRHGQDHGGGSGHRQLQRPPLDRRDRRAHHGDRHRARPRHRPARAAQAGGGDPGRRSCSRSTTATWPAPSAEFGPALVRAVDSVQARAAPPCPRDGRSDRRHGDGTPRRRSRRGGGGDRSRPVLRHAPGRPRGRRGPRRPARLGRRRTRLGPLRHPQPGPALPGRRPQGRRAARRWCCGLVERADVTPRGLPARGGRAARDRTRPVPRRATRASSTGG